MKIKCFIFNFFTIFSITKKTNNLERYGDLKKNNLLYNKLFFICESDDDCGDNLYCCDYTLYKSCCKGGINNYYNHPYNRIPIKVKIEENKYI